MALRTLLSTLLVMGLGTGSLAGQAAKKTVPGARHAAVKRSLLSPASLNQKAPVVYKAKFSTTKGDFVIEANRAWAPLGADRFYNLVKNRFYDGASFFRVVPGFVVQFGLSAKPAVSKAWRTATILDDPATQSNKHGSVTFATAGPNTRTTQVFINLGDNAALDSQGFAPFGQVVEGMDVVEKLYSGYGEQLTNLQGRIEAEGKAYLDKNFPHLDSIKSAVILPTPPAGKAPAQPHARTGKPQP